MLSDKLKCESATQANMCPKSNIRAFEASLSEFSSDILIVKQNRKNLKSPTHFCKMCGYGDFSSTRVRRHLLLRHHSLVTKVIPEKTSILADCLLANTHPSSHGHSDSEPESPLSAKICDDLPEDLSVHSDVSVSDNDENIQVVPQLKPTMKVKEITKSVTVRTPKKTACKRSAPSTQANSILKRRLLGEHVVEEIEAGEAALNASELNVKMVYHNSKFVIDSSEAFWLQGYKLPPRYELAQQHH
ncbi:uncharacterized protein LOC100899460 [Galendromus occidentalis]|uniref:Uncharacterized protein LOC100899460 n=1 Tax=Galendromus occidentalis TaxID=34638 RepID=A0AAJ6VWN8_9ACAR|nr:uncharacterized protein LOC100899460 [Galendromus occidentalis]